MLNFGASKPRVRGVPGPSGPPLDPHLWFLVDVTLSPKQHGKFLSFDFITEKESERLKWSVQDFREGKRKKLDRGR